MTGPLGPAAGWPSRADHPVVRASFGEGDSIGALLARVRLAQGKSQLRVAELLCSVAGVPTVTRHEVSRWEREERIPSAGWLRWLAVVFDLPLGELERAVATTRARRAGLLDPTAAPEAATPLPTTPSATTPWATTPWATTPWGDTPDAATRPAAPDAATPRAAAPDAATPWAAAPDAATPRPAARQAATPEGAEPRPATTLTATPWMGAATAESSTAGAAGGAAQSLAELRRMDDLMGGADLAGLVFGRLGGYARSAGPEQRATVGLRTVAELGQLASWVAADAGRPVAAARAYRLAVAAADATGDRSLAAHLLGCRAQLAAEAGDHREARRLALRALDTAGPGASAGTRALLWQRTAYAAAIGGARGACEEALIAAERAAVRRDPTRDPPWLYWFDDAHHIAMTGRCYAVLGKPAVARPLLSGVLHRVAPRGWAVCASALATAHVDAGDLDAACRLAGRALVVCVRTGSRRAIAHVRAVEPTLRRSTGYRALQIYDELAAECLPYLPGGVTAGPGDPDATRTG